MKLLSKILLALYLLILLWLVLFKFSPDLSLVVDHTRGLNVIPFADASRDNLGDVIYNFVGFVPLGLLLSLNFKRAALWRKLAFIFSFSLAAETIQFVFAIGAADITDVITNTSGGLLGLILYDVSNTYVHNEKLERYVVTAGTISLIVFVLLLGNLFSNGVMYQSPDKAGGRRIQGRLE